MLTKMNSNCGVVIALTQDLKECADEIDLRDAISFH